MTYSYIAIYSLLIFLCIFGAYGLLFFREYAKKISCLSVIYSSFLILIVLLSIKNSKMNEILVIMSSILAVFSVNLLMGIAIMKNIGANKKIDKTQIPEEN